MIDSVLAQQTKSVDQCNRIIELLFQYTETRTDIIAYVLHSKHSEFISKLPPICSAEPFKKMLHIVQRGMESGEIKHTNSWIASATIFGGAIRMIHLRLNGIIEQPLPALYAQLIEATWKGMAVNAEVVQNKIAATSLSSIPGVTEKIFHPMLRRIFVRNHGLARAHTHCMQPFPQCIVRAKRLDEL